MKKSYFYILGGLGVVFIGGFIYLRKRTKDLQTQKEKATALQNLAPTSSEPLMPIKQAVDINFDKAKKIEGELKPLIIWIRQFQAKPNGFYAKVFVEKTKRAGVLKKELDQLGYTYNEKTQTVSKK